MPSAAWFPGSTPGVPATHTRWARERRCGRTHQPVARARRMRAGLEVGRGCTDGRTHMRDTGRDRPH